MKLYSHEISGHAHRVRLFLHLLDLPHTIERIDLGAKEHQTEAFTALNPFGQLPVLEDDGITLSDSNAILTYLAIKYDPARTWLPEDPISVARIQRWLSIAAGELFLGPNRARLIKLFGAPYSLEQAHAVSTKLYTILDTILSQQKWVALPHPTLADVALYSYTAVAHEGGFDLSTYPHIITWAERFRTLDGFVEMTIQPS